MSEAVELLREAFAHDATSVDAVSEEAATELERGEPRVAEALCRALVEAVPNHGAGHYNLAVALAAQARLPEAHLHALRAAEFLPGPQGTALLARIRAAIDAAALGARPQ